MSSPVFQPELPSWLKIKLPPLILDPVVASLVAGKELLPLAWVDRRLRRERLSQQNRRTWEEYFNCVNRIVEQLEKQLESQTSATVHSISDARPPFNPPHWTGDSAEGLAAVPFPGSNVLTAEDAERLVRELGYDAHAAFAAVPRPIWMNAKPDRRRFGIVEDEDGKWRSHTTFVQPLPYVAAPARETKQGFFSRDTVLRAVAKMRAKDKMRLACIEVVYDRRSPSEVAKEFGLNIKSVKNASSRVRNTILKGIQKPNVFAGSEALVGTLSD